MSGLRETLVRALARARRLRSDSIAWHCEALSELPDVIELFAAAEENSETRFLARSEADDTTLLGIGCCAQIRAEDTRPAALIEPVRELFAGIERHGDAPLLLGGFAFRADDARDPNWSAFGSGRLTLPEVLVARRRGRATLAFGVRVSPDDDPATLAQLVVARWDRLLEKHEAPTRPQHELDAPAAGEFERRYADSVRRVLGEIRTGRADKVVLAEVEDLAQHGRRPTAAVLRALQREQPGCLLFAQGFAETTFLGATPERLVAIESAEVVAVALAGTSTQDVDLRGSRKDRDEHAYVVRAIDAALRDVCSELRVPERPTLLAAGRAQHLATEIRGTLSERVHLLELVERLHPTPAVGGTPRAAALELIREIEGFDRGWYAGPIGWIDADGEGDFHVALRCGLVDAKRIRLFAGAGIVAGSVPENEAAETRLKLSALREALESACES